MEDELARCIGNAILYYIYDNKIKDANTIIRIIKKAQAKSIEHLVKELGMVMYIDEKEWKKIIPDQEPVS